MSSFETSLLSQIDEDDSFFDKLNSIYAKGAHVFFIFILLTNLVSVSVALQCNREKVLS